MLALDIHFLNSFVISLCNPDLFYLFFARELTHIGPKFPSIAYN